MCVIEVTGDGTLLMQTHLTSLWFLLFVGSDRLTVHDPASHLIAITFCRIKFSVPPFIFQEFFIIELCTVGTVLVFIVFVTQPPSSPYRILFKRRMISALN